TGSWLSLVITLGLGFVPALGLFRWQWARARRRCGAPRAAGAAPPCPDPAGAAGRTAVHWGHGDAHGGSALRGDLRARCPLRRGLLHLRPLHRDLLPPLLPVPHTAPRPRGVRPQRGGRRRARLPGAEAAGSLSTRALELISAGALDPRPDGAVHVADLAARLHVTERTLHRALVGATGSGAIAHARLARARRAHDLLTRTSWPLAEIT